MQEHSQTLLTLDFCGRMVSYHGKTMPVGTIACAAMNIDDKMLEDALLLCRKLAPVNKLIRTATVNYSVLRMAAKAAGELLNLISGIAPFSFMNGLLTQEELEMIYSDTAINGIAAYCRKLVSGEMNQAERRKLLPTIALVELTPMLANFYDAMMIMRNGIGSFAEKLKARSRESYLTAAHEAFPDDVRINDNKDSWLSMSNVTIQYSAEKTGKNYEMVRHMHFVTFGGMLRADFFEGLAAGHAPVRCEVCKRWFLATDARLTRYCSGKRPGDINGLTCRQYAAKRGRSHRERAGAHPLKTTHRRVCAAIRQRYSRDKLGFLERDAMKRLADDHLQRAIRDVEYANDRYEEEMKIDRLMEDARKNL